MLNQKPRERDGWAPREENKEVETDEEETESERVSSEEILRAAMATQRII